MKPCKKCGKTLPLTEFYVHKGMKDGHLNKCKSCTKREARENRENNIEAYRTYDRARAKQPHRVVARSSYQKTGAYKALRSDIIARYRHNHPGRTAANAAVARAVREGVIAVWPCQVCGEDAEAHHPDYSNHLGVVWLCVDHHAQLHAEHREYLRASAESN